MNFNGSKPSPNPFARNTVPTPSDQGLVYPVQPSSSSSSYNQASTSASSSIRPDEHDAALILGLWGGMDVDKPQQTGSESPFNLLEPQQNNPSSYSDTLLDTLASGSISQNDGLATGGIVDAEVVLDDDDSSEGEGLDPFEAFQAALGQDPVYQLDPSSTSVIGERSYGLGMKEGGPEVGDVGKVKAKAPVGRPKGSKTKPKAPPKPKVPKKKPQTILISEIQINGVWVPHIPDSEGKLVPCDKRGDPLPSLPSLLPPPLPTLPGSSTRSAASTSTSNPSADAASSSRDARLGKRRRNDAAVTEIDSNDEPEIEQPRYAKKKVGVKSASEKKTLADQEQRRIRKERELELLSLPKDFSLYAIENFGFGEEGRERALENQAYHALRNSVPALRALYDTYAPFNPLTDKPDPLTGLIDGIPPIKEQNGKTTILSTAETYIQHLGKEREKIDWEKSALEEFVRKMDGGEAAWKKWKVTFDAQEKDLANIAQESASVPLVPTTQPLASSPTTKTFLLSRGARVEPAEPTFPAFTVASSSTFSPIPPSLPSLSTTMKSEPLAPQIPSTSGSASPMKQVATDTVEDPFEKEKAEAYKEKNRKKQRMFRERQKLAIANLEAEIKAVQAATK